MTARSQPEAGHEHTDGLCVPCYEHGFNIGYERARSQPEAGLREAVDALPWLDVTLEDGETGGQMIAKDAVLDLIDDRLAARSQPEAGPADHIFIHRQFEVVCAVAGCEHPPARSQPEAGLRETLRQIHASHDVGHQAGAWPNACMGCQMYATLATPTAGLDEQPVWYQRGWDEGYAAARLAKEPT